MGKKRQHPVSTCDMRTLTLIDAIGRCRIVRIVTKCFPVVLLRRLSDARTNRTRNVVIVQAYIPQTIETNACIYIIYIYIDYVWLCARMYVRNIHARWRQKLPGRSVGSKQLLLDPLLSGFRSSQRYEDGGGPGPISAAARPRPGRILVSFGWAAAQRKWLAHVGKDM
jgi:hypothetical protein